MNAEQRGASVAVGGGCPLDVPSKGEGSANDGVGVRGEDCALKRREGTVTLLVARGQLWASQRRGMLATRVGVRGRRAPT